jgi:hypothetical protein
MNEEEKKILVFKTIKYALNKKYGELREYFDWSVIRNDAG